MRKRYGNASLSLLLPYPPSFFFSFPWKQKMRNKGTILYLRNIIGFACEAHKYSFSVSIKKNKWQTWLLY